MKKFIPLLILGIAFGIIEGSVVIYLRPLFNPGESDFSLKIIPLSCLTDFDKLILATELGRELATLILLGAAAYLASKKLREWFCYFVFTFAIWDIFYYLWLYLIIQWPGSLLEWDILFLIPKPWYAPVLIPCVISLVGILYALIGIYILNQFKEFKVKYYHWLPWLIALILWQISFLNKSDINMTSFPESYSWELFYAGLAIALVPLYFLKRIVDF